MWLPGALTDMLVRFTAQFILAQTNPWHLQDHHFPAFDTTSWGEKNQRHTVWQKSDASGEDFSSEP